MKTVFLISPTQRSGTNYFRNLLVRHPDILVANLDQEDFLIANLSHLEIFVKYLDKSWVHAWHPNRREKLLAQAKVSLGIGLTHYLRPNTSEKKLYTVTKTPSSKGLLYFDEYFPDQKLIILVRDGRATVESGVQSNFWYYEMGCHRWKKGTSTILQYLEKSDPGRFLLVKYEDLVKYTAQTLKTVLTYLELDLTLYPFESLGKVKVAVSSQYKDELGRLASKPVARNRNFNPLARALFWDWKRHLLFNRICGQNAQKLGYSLERQDRKGFIYTFVFFKIDIGIFLCKKLKQKVLIYLQNRQKAK